VTFAIALVLATYIVPRIPIDVEIAGMPLTFLSMLTGVLCALAIVLWWMGFSRAPWLERLGAVALMVVAVMAMSRLVHFSVAGAGQGVLMYILAIPILSLGLVVWAVLTRRLTNVPRRAALVAAIAIAGVPLTLIRTAGVTSEGSELHWRWTPTPEERLLAERGAALPLPPPPIRAAAEPAGQPEPRPAPEAGPARPGNAAAPTSPAASARPDGSTPLSDDTRHRRGVEGPAMSGRESPRAESERELPRVDGSTSLTVDAEHHRRVEWPGFRGPNRDGVVRGLRIDTNWSASPPVQLWRRPIGPGWSSFAVRGDHVYTQEQRGEHEIVACYRLSSGEPVWSHRDQARFWESNGGAGPRATPTIHGQRVFAFGATGILNAFDADTGALAWSRNVASDTGRAVPDWGFAASPLVVGDLVIVAAAGTLAAYDVATGDPRWRGPSYGGSYSSPHQVTLGGSSQVVLLGGPGAISVAPDTGAVLWQHEWSPGPIVQPAVTEDGDLLVNTILMTGGVGIRRLGVSRGPEGWATTERWTSSGLKPYFNDFVVHEGHAYGFDGAILASVNLSDGKRNWKGGRYGNGQMVLLSDQDVLLVLSEEGEMALVSATTEKFTEIARAPALEGKTWNHPVIVGDVLLVRNGQEMAAFRLTRSGS
jgi:outer membrane protein assembly factor BamB